jgi:flagellar basal body-associated protein FliL
MISMLDNKQLRSANKKSPRGKKILLIVIGFILILGVAGGVTAFVISNSTKSTPTTKTAEQQAADLAKQANDAATASATKGDTHGALDHYNEALIQYKKAGDKAGEEGVKLQIQYYETVKANEEKAKTTQEAESSSNNELP